MIGYSYEYTLDNCCILFQQEGWSRYATVKITKTIKSVNVLLFLCVFR